MRTLTRLGLILLLALPLGASAGSTASAAEPASVLITDPARHRTASAALAEHRYRELAAAIGAEAAAGRLPVSGEAPPSGYGEIFRSDLRVTWLRDDAAIWRIDLIFFIRGSVWIATSRAWVAEPDQLTWHRAADPVRLRTLLAETDLLPRSATPPAPVSGPEPPPDTPAAAALVLAAGALGIMLGAAGTLLLRRRR